MAQQQESPRVWTEAGFVDDDPWALAGADAPEGVNHQLIYQLKEFLELADDDGKKDVAAVLVEPDDDVEALAPHLDRLALVAVAFPAFNDGRGFSHASLLRSRLGYSGELRAVGQVLLDQIPLMMRCGFTSFSLTDPVTIRRAGEGRLAAIANHYQPAARPAGGPEGYSWRRVAAAAG